MMVRTLLLGLALSFAVPAAAQDAPASAPAIQVPPVEEEGLSGTVTDESAWQDLGIAIPSFATNANQPTPARHAARTHAAAPPEWPRRAGPAARRTCGWSRCRRRVQPTAGGSWVRHFRRSSPAWGSS